jgi:Uma2 family endonuclease
MIIEGEPNYQGKSKTTITNPSVIIEVLSKSTQDYDRGTKFNYYRSIPELKEYLLIDQYSYSIEKFAKNSANQWVLTDWQGGDIKVSLDSLNFEVKMLDIYENVDFNIQEEDQQS